MNPYADQALQYLDGGLGYPIPSAYPFEKFPPLSGWTGRFGHRPDRAQVNEWRETYADSNILLRLAKNVVGIDVDAYEGKTGDNTIHKAGAEHGKLPTTVMSSARGDGVSGIHFYKLESWIDERDFKGDFGPDSHVEVIRYSHRYAVVPPSWHPKVEARYRWYNWEKVPPSILTIPHLPGAWVKHLEQKCGCFYERRKAAREQLARYRNRPTNKQGSLLAELDFLNGVETLAKMPPGSRNNYLSRLAGRTFLYDCLLNGVLDGYEVHSKLMDAALEAGLDEHEALATLESAKAWAMNIGENE